MLTYEIIYMEIIPLKSACINMDNNLFALPTTKSVLLFLKIYFIALK